MQCALRSRIHCCYKDSNVHLFNIIFIHNKTGGLSMYMDDYKRWLEADLQDFDLKTELMNI